MRKVITNYDIYSVELMNVDTKQVEHVEWENIIKRLQRSDKPRYLDKWSIIEDKNFPEFICVLTGKDIVYITKDFSNVIITKPERISSVRCIEHCKVTKAPWILRKINIVLSKIIMILKRYVQ